MRKIRVLSSFLIILFPLGIATAQDIPSPLLESDRKSCKASCVQTYSGKKCTQLCDCTISAFKQKVNFDHYLQMIAEISQNRVSEDTSKLMNAIAKECSGKISIETPQLAKVTPKEDIKQ